MDLKKTKLSVVDTPVKVTGEKLEIVVLYADMRKFSDWACTASLDQVAEVVRIEYERVVQLAQDYKHSFHKFLGDGFLLLWEVKDYGTVADALHWATGAAFEIHKKYWYVAKDLGYPAPLGLGIGISCGEAVKVQPETFIRELNELDFVGYPMNCGARLQGLAGPYGVVLDSAAVEVAIGNANRVLRNGMGVVEYVLLDPTPEALKKVLGCSGLTTKDKTGFKYLTWPHVQNKLWKVDGRI